MTETLDTLLTTSGTYRDYGYFYLPLMTTTGTLDALMTSSCIYRDSRYFNWPPLVITGTLDTRIDIYW